MPQADADPPLVYKTPRVAPPVLAYITNYLHHVRRKGHHHGGVYEKFEPFNSYDNLRGSRNDLQVRVIRGRGGPDNNSPPHSACTHSLEEGLSPHPAIQAVSVSLMNNSMQVTYDTHGITPIDICGLTDDLGYEATEWETTMYTPESTTTVDTSEREVLLRFEGATSSYAPHLLFGGGF